MKNFTYRILLITGLLFVINASTNAQINTIRFDSTFGYNGILSNSAPQNFNETMFDMAIQPDGKILAAGCSGNAGRQPTVVRFLSTGVVDSTFGTYGYTYLDYVGDLASGVGTIKLISNGRMLVSACDDANYNGYMRYFVARLDSTGAIDTTFGTEGYAYIIKGKRLQPPKMVVFADGSIVTQYPLTTYESVLVKLDSNGIADNTFGINDSLPITEMDNVTSLKLDNNGNILAAGAKADSNDIGVVRILPNGQRDNTFGNNGLVLYSYYDNLNSVYDVGSLPIPVVQSNGDILVTFGIYNAASPLGTIRLHQNGSLDTGYGNNGIALSLTYAPQVADVLLMENDELLIASSVSIGNFSSPLADMAVLTNAGILDTVFHNGATSIFFALDTEAIDSYTLPSSVKVLPDHKILFGGAAIPSVNTLGFARFNYTGFITTGIEQPAPVGEMQLYPNPASSYAVVKYSSNQLSPAKVKVFDMLGKLIIETTITGQPSAYRVDATGLGNGVYTVEIQSGGQVATRKLVVQH